MSGQEKNNCSTSAFKRSNKQFSTGNLIITDSLNKVIFHLSRNIDRTKRKKALAYIPKFNRRNKDDTVKNLEFDLDLLLKIKQNLCKCDTMRNITNNRQNSVIKKQKLVKNESYLVLLNWTERVRNKNYPTTSPVRKFLSKIEPYLLSLTGTDA